jgi:hypothetical protein
MNLARRAGSFAEVCYATVFFVDDTATKVFKRRDDAPANHVKHVFDSEVAAYQHSTTRSEIHQYTHHFVGVKAVCRIEDENGHDISHEYHLDFAYTMLRLTGNPIEIGNLDPELAQHIKSLFRDAGVRHMDDCSVFLDHTGKLKNVIDFALQEYVLEHDPL